MTTLSYNQNVRLAAWGCMDFAKVFTIEGYSLEAGMDPEAAVARSVARGHALVGTIYTGSALVDDGGAYYARTRAEAAKAITISDGDAVEIEGRHYVVRVIPGNHKAPRNSDPISFRAA